MMPHVTTPPASGAAARLVEWLAGTALPLWHDTGRDADGGFYEALDMDAQALSLPRRARVAPRQLFAFCHGRTLGWCGEIGNLARRGVDAIQARFRRPDGLYRTLVAPDGSPLDDTALLYDQAFVLLGFAAVAAAGCRGAELEQLAGALRERIARAWQLAPGQFRSGENGGQWREANPHMHLLEACLAWAEISPDPTWAKWVSELLATAQAGFVDGASGVLFETYDGNWRRVDDVRIHAVEPGHQYEWAWLMLRAAVHGGSGSRDIALRLIDRAEAHGVHDGVAVNGLDAQLAVRDPNARLWVQTERLRACAAAYRLTGQARYRNAADMAAASLQPYLRTPVPGLWFDERMRDGQYRAGVVHASTFYHLVSAAREIA